MRQNELYLFLIIRFEIYVYKVYLVNAENTLESLKLLTLKANHMHTTLYEISDSEVQWNNTSNNVR